MPKQPPSFDGEIDPAYDIGVQLEAIAEPWPFPSPIDELVARWGKPSSPSPEPAPAVERKPAVWPSVRRRRPRARRSPR